MLVSIVIPTYNQGPYIRDCLESVTGQTYKNLEIIIQDSCSSDETEKICLEFAEKDKRVRYFRETDKGQSDAINRGLARSSGYWWNWICSDDRYNSFSVIEKLVYEFEQKYMNQKDFIGIYGNACFITEQGSYISDYHNKKKILGREDFQLTWPLSQPSCLLKRAAVADVGGVNADLYLGMDLDLFFKIMKKQEKVSFLDYLICDIRIQDNSKSIKYRKDTAKNALDLVRFHMKSTGPLHQSDYFKEYLFAAESDEINEYLTTIPFLDKWRILYELSPLGNLKGKLKAQILKLASKNRLFHRLLHFTYNSWIVKKILGKR
ncbi:MAG TPA: glycosyltransferase [Leptospiraceae bacterium]|nr:glycosyltransferase [Leptospiraceae bacterium]HMY66297.1 glycosyltransferase [Leptospiraceae bacterium]HMZ57879.1 glycosyltransferase [Leptospiraceae bacterium]HNF12152.1 glycosyltransferase [Leptospiraceae bacterium]HNF24945.1 glycosyltransferase [Leptospiraceae bacterium]